MADIDQSQTALNTALQQVATGKSVSQPSDNPVASAEMVQNSIQTADVDQYTQNISSLLSTVQSAGSALSSVAAQLTQAVSLGTEGANGTNSASDLQSLATEVQSILSNVVGLANTSVAGNYLFGGTVTNQPPYTADSSSSTGYAYNGNNDSNSVAVGENLNVQTNLPGSQIFSGSTNSVLGALSGLLSALQSGNSSSIASATTSVTSAHQLAEPGAGLLQQRRSAAERSANGAAAGHRDAHLASQQPRRRKRSDRGHEPEPGRDRQQRCPGRRCQGAADHTAQFPRATAVSSQRRFSARKLVAAFSRQNRRGAWLRAPAPRASPDYAVQLKFLRSSSVGSAPGYFCFLLSGGIISGAGGALRISRA